MEMHISHTTNPACYSAACLCTQCLSVCMFACLSLYTSVGLSFSVWQPYDMPCSHLTVYAFASLSCVPLILFSLPLHFSSFCLFFSSLCLCNSVPVSLFLSPLYFLLLHFGVFLCSSIPSMSVSVSLFSLAVAVALCTSAAHLKFNLVQLRLGVIAKCLGGALCLDCEFPCVLDDQIARTVGSTGGAGLAPCKWYTTMLSAMSEQFNSHLCVGVDVSLSLSLSRALSHIPSVFLSL